MPLQAQTNRTSPPYVVWYSTVQAFLALDFVLLLPLGPDLASSLGFAPEHLGWLSGTYSLGALVGGLACLALLDRWPRKTALLLSLLLLSSLALLMGLVASLSQLVAVRFVQGLVSAPAAALLVATVIDQTAPTLRGRIIGRVMLGFTLAMVLGVPLGLWGAQQFGWRALLVGLALVQGAWCALGYFCVPNLPRPKQPVSHESGPVGLLAMLAQLWQQAPLRRALVAQASNTCAVFLVVPSFSAFYLSNLAWPREQLAPLYLLGGITTFFALRFWGWMCDEKSPQTAYLGALFLTLYGLLPVLVPGAGLGVLPHWSLLAGCFCAFMAANACRQLSLTAYTSQLPHSSQRGAYLSLEHAVQDGAAALGAAAASFVFWLLPPSAATEAADLAFEPTAMVWLGGLTLLFAAIALYFQRAAERAVEPRLFQP